MRTNPSLNHKLMTYWDARVSKGYEDLRKMSACAGIRGEIDAANRARWNHYGEVITRSDGTVILLPARRWVMAGLEGPANEATLKIAKIIKDRIKEADPLRNDGFYRADPRATAFGGTKEKANSPRMIMQAIANQIAQNQRDVILQRQLKPNAPSTVKRKKGDMPMVWTGEMFSEIRGFVEEK